MCFVKVVIKNQEILDLPEALSRENTSGKSLGLSHVDNPAFLLSEPDDSLLLVEAANVYVTIPTKMAIFHHTLFYSSDQTVLVELHEFHRNYAADMYPKFKVFMTVILQGLSSTLQSLIALLLANMPLFESGSHDKKKSWLEALCSDRTISSV